MCIVTFCHCHDSFNQWQQSFPRIWIAGRYVAWKSHLSQTTAVPLIRLVNKCMMPSPNGNIFRVTGPLWGESTGHRWILFTKASDTSVFSLNCAWTNGWRNNRDAGDLRHHGAQYNAIVMATWNESLKYFEMISRSLTHCDRNQMTAILQTVYTKCLFLVW